jgi:hypothetical protein
MKTDYLINGLESMSLQITIMGTTHFMNNLVSGWYDLAEVDLTAGEATLFFTPNKDIEKAYPADRYSITFSAHEDFSLIVKDQYDTQNKTTIKYLFLNCRKNDAGEPYFHYDIVQKTFKQKVATEGIHIDTTAEQLLREGYNLIKSVDDANRSSNSVILEYHRKAS